MNKLKSTYKLGLIFLDDVFVFLLVLLHPQLGVFHINVVCEVIHCRKTSKNIKSFYS